MMSSHRRRNAFLQSSAALIAFIAVTWLFVLAPRISTSVDLQSQAEAIETANISQQHRLTELTKMALDAPTTASRVQALLSRMPQEAQLPQLFTQLTAAARSAGIPADQISAITQSVPIPLDDPSLSTTGPVEDAQQSAQRANIRVAKLDVMVAVTGTTKEVQDFVKNIEGLERDFLVTGVTIANQSGGDIGADRVASITATTFVLQSKLPDLVKSVNDLLAQAGR